MTETPPEHLIDVSDVKKGTKIRLLFVICDRKCRRDQEGRGKKNAFTIAEKLLSFVF
jgi:hypothetical protein